MVRTLTLTLTLMAGARHTSAAYGRHLTMAASCEVEGDMEVTIWNMSRQGCCIRCSQMGEMLRIVVGGEGQVAVFVTYHGLMSGLPGGPSGCARFG